MTVLDATVIDGRPLPAISTQPTSLVAVEDQCARIEAWAETCDSVPALRDAGNKLAAIDEYLRLTSTEGRAIVAATRRRLEAWIGDLLPDPVPGERTDLSSATDRLDDGLTKDQRSEFRSMAAHRDVVEDVIAASTDEVPASRRKVTDAIKAQGAPSSPPVKPRRSPLPEQAQSAGWQLRKAVERIERIAADDRFPAHRDQVAAALRSHLTTAIEVCQDLLDGLERG